MPAFPPTVILWVLGSVVRSATADEHKEDDTTTISTTTCGVWLAESTIPGAGLGMFAGIDYNPGDQITPGDLVVPYVDLAWHTDVEDEDVLGFLWNEYVPPHTPIQGILYIIVQWTKCITYTQRMGKKSHTISDNSVDFYTHSPHKVTLGIFPALIGWIKRE
jgi:hypothetical protein